MSSRVKLIGLDVERTDRKLGWFDRNVQRWFIQIYIQHQPELPTWTPQGPVYAEGKSLSPFFTPLLPGTPCSTSLAILLISSSHTIRRSGWYLLWRRWISQQKWVSVRDKWLTIRSITQTSIYQGISACKLFSPFECKWIEIELIKRNILREDWKPVSSSSSS